MGEIKKIKDEPKHGRKQNQKLKPYVVLQYLMKETDENHLLTSYDTINHKFVDLPVKIVIFHRKTLLICWGKIGPINQECLLLQLKKFIALILPNRPYQQKFVAQTTQKEKPKMRCAPIRIVLPRRI